MKSLKKLYNVIVILFLCLSFLACNNENAFDCVKSTGPVIVQKRKISPFSYIILKDDINLSLSNQSGQTVILEGGKNIINNIILKNMGDTLIISNSNTCKWVRNYKPINILLGIQQESLGIVHRGYGQITSVDSLHIPNLSAHSLDAGGNITLQVVSSAVTTYSNSHSLINISGQANQAYFWINKGIGKICAENLQVDNCTVINGGSNEIRVFPINYLEVEILENGNVAYYHDPTQIKSTIKGSGKLIRK